MNSLICMLYHNVVDGQCQTCREVSDDDEEDDPYKVLEEEFDSLTLEEKIIVHNDLYGKEKLVDETESFLNERHSELDSEIRLLSEENNKAYFKAMEQEEKEFGNTKEYVRSRKFHLMFLRADKYNPRFAARRITRFFTDKLSLFGEAKLSKKIKQDDLNEQDMKALTSGGLCTNGSTDEGGRLVFLSNRNKFLFTDYGVTNMMRASFYFILSTIEDNEESQKKGCIRVCNFTLDESSSSTWGISQLRKLLPYIRLTMYSVPFRIAAYHLYYNNTFDHYFMKMVVHILPQYARRRVIFHFLMDYEDLVKELENYGIARGSLPLSPKGEFQETIVKQYFEAKRQTEKE